MALLFLLQQKQQQRDQEQQPCSQIDKLIRDQMRIVQGPAQKAGQQQICRKYKVKNDRRCHKYVSLPRSPRHLFHSIYSVSSRPSST